MDILGASSNSFILLGVLIIMVFAVAYALFSRKGSGISLTPTDKSNAGAVGPSEESGKDQGQGSATGSDTYGTSDPQHGTQ